MVRRFSSIAVLAGLLAAPAWAQQPAVAVAPPVARCTGLLCDAYYAGKPLPAPGQPDVPSPMSLPCRDFICAAFGGRTPEPPPAVADAAPEPLAAPVKPSKRKRKTRKVASAEDAKTKSAEASKSAGDATR